MKITQNMLQTAHASIIKQDLGINPTENINIDEICLYHLQELTVEEYSQSIENVFSALTIENINVIYLIIGNKKGVNFYFGVVQNKYKSEIEITNIGEDILKQSMQGNFRGSKVVKLDEFKRQELINTFDEMSHYGVIEGVPGVMEPSNQRVDRLIDVMLGEMFAVCLLAAPLSFGEIDSIEQNLYEVYDSLSDKNFKFAPKVDKKNTTKNLALNTFDDDYDLIMDFDQPEIEVKEEPRRNIQEWIKYIDEIMLKRLDYGKGKGLFLTTTFLATTHRPSLTMLGNTMKALYSGYKGNKVPIEFIPIYDKKLLKLYKNFQIPLADLSEEERLHSIYSQHSVNNTIPCANWISTNELALMAGLPHKEVVGLSIKEEIEFGLNFTPLENQIDLGKLIQRGNKLDVIVGLNKDELNQNIFVTGITGSGKTTTCQNILLASNLPYMVIEPVKTEYRILVEDPEVIIFTLGHENLAPFRLNPFEFYPHENISSRVDRIKASIEAGFNIKSSISPIIETAIHECYRDYGWSISSNKNRKFADPFADGVYAFPTISDLIVKITELSFDGYSDINSIKARLYSLTVGAKGLMLNSKRSVDFKDLLYKKVILELDGIKNGTEKALITGFILTNLNEALKANFLENPDFNHITLIEESHRLLKRYGDRQSVEVFSDMLAKVSNYGEALIIVDQIPNELMPEVLKNTNTKIIHKLYAQEDKETIGNAIALSQSQKEFLSRLQVGRAVVFSQGWNKSMQVQINCRTYASKAIVDNDTLRMRALEYYRSTYKRGIIPGLQWLEQLPNLVHVDAYMDMIQEEIMKDEYTALSNGRSNISLYQYFNSIVNVDTQDFINFAFSLYPKVLTQFQRDVITTLINDIASGKLEVGNITVLPADTHKRLIDNGLTL
ncbi:MAG: hypothetical protein ATN34_04455 [Epulopiscium sp. Nele67-Bin002]|nr:MAG: hypothetical protein ATN33_02900 [Epulopiscium sp. Nele67-Bin001]OON91152.1 MAG: hypothetical protein ATN34_04455 [Epulopiscium sp. Nele67-Bin002]